MMKRLISTQSKKNTEKVRKRLQGTCVVINIPGEMSGEVTCAEALPLGFRLLAMSKPDEALVVAEALLAKVDDIVDIYLLKARALLDLEALGELKELIDPLVAAAPSNRGVLMVAARYYYLLGQASKSLMLAKKAAASDSRNVESLLHMELCYRYSGSTEKSSQILKLCLQIAGPKHKNNDERFQQFSAALLRLANHTLLSNERLAELEEIYVGWDDPLLKTQTAYALASQAAKRKDQTAEIEYLLVANAAECRMLGLENSPLKNSYENKYTLLTRCFDSSKPAWFPDTITANHAPVFVLGLPRSGTTLLEQMLGGHSSVGQVGESKGFLSALRRACRKINPLWSYADYPNNIERLSSEALQGIVDKCEFHQSLLTEKIIYIDKELSNFEYVGLMALLFPKAKFIHMDRAPMDVFLSCFRNSIPGVPETANLKAVAEYYVYMKRLIGHWRSVFQGRILIINYQSLVHEPEKFARQAADFIDIEFEPAMLDFHQRKNIVRTLSVDQVRKKIYTSSIEGWRAYSEALEPAREVLEKNNIPLEGVAFL
ncbi:MAG: sulfotransferase [Pseudomonadales bacterium]|nr:sulfotransferase [Pseudomonadales bacterium]